MFVSYFPLASGQLTSYDELTAPAERLGATPAQVALAWLLRRSPAMVVIPGTTNPDQGQALNPGPEAADIWSQTHQRSQLDAASERRSHYSVLGGR